MEEKEIKKIVLKNDTKTTYSHGVYTLNPGSTLPIPEDIANIWLQVKGINEYIDPAVSKQAEAKAKEETDKIKSELEKAKDEIEKLKAENEKLKETKSEGEKQAEAKAKEETKKSNSTK